jgi:hypothetical protein
VTTHQGSEIEDIFYIRVLNVDHLSQQVLSAGRKPRGSGWTWQPQATQFQFSLPRNTRGEEKREKGTGRNSYRRSAAKAIGVPAPGNSRFGQPDPVSRTRSAGLVIRPLDFARATP